MKLYHWLLLSCASKILADNAPDESSNVVEHLRRRLSGMKTSEKLDYFVMEHSSHAPKQHKGNGENFRPEGIDVKVPKHANVKVERYSGTGAAAEEVIHGRTRKGGRNKRPKGKKKTKSFKTPAPTVSTFSPGPTPFTPFPTTTITPFPTPFTPNPSFSFSPSPSPYPFPTQEKGAKSAKGVGKGKGKGNKSAKGINTPFPTPFTPFPTPFTPFPSMTYSPGPTLSPSPTPKFSKTVKSPKSSKKSDFCDPYTFSRRRLQYGGEDCFPNVLDRARLNDNLETFVSLVELAGLNRVFDCPGPFTCLPPTDEAFAQLGPDVLEWLIQRENRAVLREVLLGHVLPGAIFSNEFVPGLTPTLSGNDVLVSTTPLSFNTSLAEEENPIRSCNGLLYVRDTFAVVSVRSLTSNDSTRIFFWFHRLSGV
jgi:uncharacterized surface protein with fasciclin (FAS1) repeats